MSRRWTWVALAAVVLATIGWVAWPSGEESIDAHVTRLASELRCVECEGLSVADASTSTARATRADIRGRIEDGQSDAEIRQAYVDLYGERILLTPTSSGVGVLVWALPVAVLVVAAVGVGFVVWRGRRTPRLAASHADEDLVARAEQRRTYGDDDLPADDPRIDERDFLLRSLDDLDVEHAAGDLDPESYTTLHADYTARAATLLRELERPHDEVPSVPQSVTEAPPVPWRRRLIVGGAVLAFACVAGVLLALALGARLPGDLPTGNEATVSADERERRLRQAVADNADDANAHLALANWLVQADDLPGALAEFDTAAELDPTDPEAPAQAGWIVFLTATNASDPDQRTALLERARERLDRAIAVDPDYADAHFYRGMLRYRGEGDAAGAVPDLQRYLVLAPDTPLADQVREVLAAAVADAQGEDFPNR